MQGPRLAATVPLTRLAVRAVLAITEALPAAGSARWRFGGSTSNFLMGMLHDASRNQSTKMKIQKSHISTAYPGKDRCIYIYITSFFCFTGITVQFNTGIIVQIHFPGLAVTTPVNLTLLFGDALCPAVSDTKARFTLTNMGLSENSAALNLLVMTNSSPWKDPPIFKFGKPSISIRVKASMASPVNVITRW